MLIGPLATGATGLDCGAAKTPLTVAPMTRPARRRCHLFRKSHLLTPSFFVRPDAHSHGCSCADMAEKQTVAVDIFDHEASETIIILVS